MATKWISPTWRMPENNNQSKFDNYSLNFNNSVTNKINCGSATSYDNFTLSAWVKKDYLAPQYAGIFGTRNGTAATWPYMLGTDNTGKIRFVADGSVNIYSDDALTNEVWYHVVGVGDGTNLKLYINGSLQTDVKGYSTPLPVATNDLMIGAQYNTDSSFEWIGEISQCSLFDYALSETQIKYLYNNNDTVNPTVANPQNPMAIPGNSPIAYYDLGGSSTGDAAAASPNTLTVPNSSVPSATVFDFVNTGTGISGSDNILTGGFNLGTSWAFSLWLKMDDDEQNIILSSPNYATSNVNFTVRYENTGKINFYSYNGTSSNSNGAIGSSAVVPSTPLEWTHFVVTADGTNNGGAMYWNNQPITLSSNTAVTLALDDLLNGLYIGADINGSNDNFNGLMSNVQAYNTKLQASDVETLYNYGSPLQGTQPQAANLKGWWRMNIDTSNWDGSNWEIGDNRSAYKKAIDTTGPSGGFKTSSTSLSDFMGNSATNFSFSMWIRGTIGDTSSSALASFAVPTSGYKNNIWNYNFYGGLCLLLDAANRIGFGQINDGKWKHVLITVDTNAGSNWDDVVKCFVNGQPQSHVPGKTIGSPPSSFDWLGSYNGVPSNQRSVGVGVGLGSYNSYHGDMSNFTIYNSTLGQSEATTLYNNGTPVTTAVGSPLAWWKLNNLTDGLLDVSGNSYNIQALGSGQVVVDTLVSTSNGTSSGMTTASLVNSDLERSIPYSSYSMEFDGINDFIDCGDALGNSLGACSNASLSVWFKNVNNTTEQGIIAIDKSSFAQGNFTLWKAAAGNIKFGIGGSNYIRTPIASYPAGVWYHIAITYDGSESVITNGVKMYINGNLINTITHSGSTPASVNFTSENLVIGAAAQNTNTYGGNISNAAVFDYTLTEDQVLTIYNGGVPNDISSLSPVAWCSLAGDSYYNGSTWTCPDLSSNSNNGNGVMETDSLKGEGPGSEANGVGTGMNIPGNLQGNAPNSSSNAFSVNMNFGDKTSDVPVVP